MMPKIHKRLLYILFLSVITAAGVTFAADSYDTLKIEYDSISGSGKANRAALTSLGDRFYRLYASGPTSQNADYAILYAGKCYKSAHTTFGVGADIDTAMKYFRIVSTNYNSSAAAEAYLETAELHVSKKDLASAQYVLKRIKTRFPGTPQDLAADSMLKDLDKMAVKSTSPMDTTFTIPPVVLNTRQPTLVEPVSPSPEPDIMASFNAAPSDTVSAEDINPDGVTAVTGIRFFSAGDYTRVVIDLSQNARFEQKWLPENKEQKMPPRLFIDIYDSTVTKGVPQQMEIKDGLVKSIRWAYNRPGVTRIVLDSELDVKEHTVFQLGSPSRIVMDVSGNGTALASARPSIPVASSAPNLPTRPSGGDQTLASAFGLKIRTVVIDPGHGGKDPGCVYNGLKEKDIVLDIAKHLRDLLKQNNDIKVYMTRETDVFIPLEERTAIANKYKADLFISVHINAAKNPGASGIETYVLNVTKDAAALELAAFENSATTKSISDLQGILQDIMLSSKLQESLLLAKYAQDNIVATAKMKSLGVKQAPFYVLVGAKMPAILVETGFLSNKDDAKLLATTEHRKKIAQGLHKGIDTYITKYNK